MGGSDIQPGKSMFNLISEKDPPGACRQRKDIMKRSSGRLFQKLYAVGIGARKTLSKEAGGIVIVAILGHRDEILRWVVLVEMAKL